MNKIELRAIHQLTTDFSFFIPSYQRGYRWDQQQVENLLNDLYEFMQKQASDQFYCLQPIVVRKREELDYEVIDGQQRLTTISILLQCLGDNTYSVTYETRPGSQELLKHVKDYVDKEPSNVDQHYFVEAYRTIQSWLIRHFAADVERQEEFLAVLQNDTMVIWYEVDEQVDVHDLFMRLNIGKIALTNAELIKATLLQPLSPYDRQELALQWDQMEQALQNDAFWYFIEPSRTYVNRIELLFDLIVGKSEKHHDPYHTLYELPNHEAFWDETRRLFARLQEWYTNREMYHLIGYLLHANTRLSYSLKQLIALYKDETIETKAEFVDQLRGRARRTLPNQLQDIVDYRYGDLNDQRAIQNVLLLFNILEEIRSVRDTHRFPFDHYAKEKWSLEHIHAQKTEEFTKREQWNEWLKDAQSVMEYHEQSQMASHIKELCETEFNRKEFNQIVAKIEQVLHDHDIPLIMNSDALHSLGNLALLDRNVNTKLGNHYYPVKFAALKAHERIGGYVPPATRNVFWKYYTDQPGHFEYWSSADQLAYVTAIIQRFQTYFKETADVHA